MNKSGNIGKLSHIKLSSTKNSSFPTDIETEDSDQIIDQEEVSSERKINDIDLEQEKVEVAVSNNNDQENIKSNNSFPSFLSKLQSGISKQSKNNNVEPNRALTPISESEKKINPNSFGSIFNKDHDEIEGVQRVFKKSIAFLVINLALFGILALMSVNIFNIPVLAIVLTSIAFMTITNIFFIIVADRSYVWLSISGQIILLLLVHSFLGEGFNPITLFSSILLAVLIFSAYSELEKIQLGSRLFFISHITGETTRIMSTAVAIVMALGLFSSMVSQTPSEFARKYFLDNAFIRESIIIGNNPRLSLNSLFLKSNQIFGEGNQTATFRNFLISNYRNNQIVLTETEESDILIGCETSDSSANTNCQEIVNAEIDKRLQDWRREAYPRINYSLDTIIRKEEFDQIITEHYIYLINDISNADESIIPIPNNYIVPGVFALGLFVFLILIKVVINWLVYLSTWILWKVLRWVGFAKIEIEAVEAEIVSI